MISNPVSQLLLVKKAHSSRLSCWIVVFLTMILSGCVSTSSLLVPGKPATHLSHYTIDGRMSATQGTQGAHFNVRWQQQASDYRIRLSGPLGVGVGEISGDMQHSVLHTADGRIVTARTPDQLAYQETGFLLPISALQSWIRGVPLPHDPVKNPVLLGNGAYQTFNQMGWHITYQAYTTADGFRLPTKICLEKIPLSALIIIDRWTVN